VEVSVAAGAAIDLATRGDLAGHHSKLADLLARPNVHGQRLYGFTATGSGPLVIDLGSPPMGMLWIPQDLSVFGADPFLAASNAQIANVSAAAFAGSRARAQALGLGPPVTGLDMQAVFEAGFTIPRTIDLPSTRKVIYPQERFYVVLAGTGLVAGATVYQATSFVLEVILTDTALQV
jgi:hypothetical protein